MVKYLQFQLILM